MGAGHPEMPSGKKQQVPAVDRDGADIANARWRSNRRREDAITFSLLSVVAARPVTWNGLPSSLLRVAVGGEGDTNRPTPIGTEACTDRWVQANAAMVLDGGPETRTISISARVGQALLPNRTTIDPRVSPRDRRAVEDFDAGRVADPATRSGSTTRSL